MMKMYTGCVENRNDPLKLGRCQVRIVGLHTENRVHLPTSDLPWAYPVMPVTSASTSGIGQSPIGPVEGSWVLITFMDADEQQPMMLGTLGGAFQTADALESGEAKTVTTSADGTIELSPLDPATVTPQAGSTQSTSEAGKVQTNKDEIIGPLAKLIAKGESGAAGYNAFNRGSGAKPGTGSIGGEKVQLTEMKIKDIMNYQSLSPSAPDRLFAVGKYQCIPTTLREACGSLNINTDQKFTETIQDLICQEYLVGRKRPKLIAYYRNTDKNNDSLLKAASRSLAAEFASIEDPDYPGFPYGGEHGRYYKAGNRVKTSYSSVRQTLIQEWDFRNNPKGAPPSTLIAAGDKVEKGTDYSGVAKAAPADDSAATAPREASSSPAAVGLGDIGNLGNLTSSIPGLDSVGGLANLEGLGLSADLLGSLDSSLLSSITGEIANFTKLIDSFDINGALGGVLGDFGNLTKELGFDVGAVLGDFGTNLNEIAANLGIENLTGSTTELIASLGINNPTPEKIIKELASIANSPIGQAKSLLAKLEEQGEPTTQSIAPLGQVNPDGTISTGLPVDPNLGFQDPNGVYPKYKNEPDTNRLAAGNNLGRTYVVKKEAALKTGVRIANGGTWDQTPVPYNATYPYNKVKQTESGHVEEWDDTPGSERIHFYHRSGSHFEWDSNGTQVNRIVGDNYEIMERNGFIYVKGACNVTVDGALNVRTDNIMNLEVSGAAKINIYNDANINVSGNANFAVGGEFNLKASKVNIESDGQLNLKAHTGLNMMSTKDMNILSDASIMMEALADINAKATGSVFLNSEIDVNAKAAGNVKIEAEKNSNVKSGISTNIQSGAKMSLNAGAELAMDGAVINLNNGGAESADGATDAIGAKPAGQADLELPIETRGTSGYSSLPQMAVATRGSETGFDAPDTGDSNAYANKKISNNEVAKSDITEPKFATEVAKPTGNSASSPGTVAGLDAIRNMPADQFTAGMKLSKYFTLGDLTKGGVRIPRVTYNVRGVNITAQEIVCNLKVLAEKVLDPIREKYGPFTITSAFRRPPFGATPGDLGGNIKEGGDHPIGCAADIVFPGGKQETYRICTEIPKLITSWNQVIMEYNGNQFWIHVSCRPASNKGDMFTMNHHKTYAGTFPKGGFVLV
jgi:hypothetical protein